MKKNMKKTVSSFIFVGILLSFAVATAWDPAENKDFFVDLETGEPNAIVVVGAYAAPSDVTGGAWVAAQMGSMCWYEETVMTDVVESWSSGENFKDDYGDNMNDKDDKGSSNADAILVGDTSGYFNGIPYQRVKSLWWDDKNENKKLEKNESREEIYVNFTHGLRMIEGEMTTIYPVVLAGPNYGYEYRVVVEGEAQKEVWEDSDSGETYTIYTDPVSVTFLGEKYDILYFGENKEHGDYILYGTPQLKEEAKFEVGETKEFNGWEVTPKNTNIYENSIEWLIIGPETNRHEYTARMADDERSIFGIKDEICNIEETVFALESLRVSPQPSGETIVVANVYVLKNYGIIKDAVVIQPCGSEGLQWTLDVIRDVDIEYWDGNPYYIMKEDYDDYNYNDRTPDFSDSVKENIIALKIANTLNLFVKYYAKKPTKVALCKFEIPMCGIDDFWVNSEDAPVYIELMIDESEDKQRTDLEIKGGFEVTHYAGEEITTEYVKVEIDPMSIMVNDDEVTDTMKASSNLVLVGGPGLVVCEGAEPQICNTLTKELCDQKLSTIDWFNSVGEYEYIANAFVEGKDVIIVAGKEREATRKAVEILLNRLNA